MTDNEQYLSAEARTAILRYISKNDQTDTQVISVCTILKDTIDEPLESMHDFIQEMLPVDILYNQECFTDHRSFSCVHRASSPPWADSTTPSTSSRRRREQPDTPPGGHPRRVGRHQRRRRRTAQTRREDPCCKDLHRVIRVLLSLLWPCHAPAGTHRPGIRRQTMPRV